MVRKKKQSNGADAISALSIVGLRLAVVSPLLYPDAYFLWLSRSFYSFHIGFMVFQLDCLKKETSKNKNELKSLLFLAPTLPTTAAQMKQLV